MEDIRVTKDGATYFLDSPHFVFEEQWDDFVSTLNMEDENIRLLVEEVEYQRARTAEYYEWYLNNVL